MTTVVQHKLVTILNVVDRNYECRYIIYNTYYNITHSIMNIL